MSFWEEHAMIPKNITKDSIIQAINTIDIDGVPKIKL